MSRLHDALYLSSTQEAAWRAYADAVAPDPAVEARRQSAASLMHTLPTPCRIDLISAEMTADMASTRRQGDAVNHGAFGRPDGLLVSHPGQRPFCACSGR